MTRKRTYFDSEVIGARVHETCRQTRAPEANEEESEGSEERRSLLQRVFQTRVVVT
jgi:hypothetical protein